MSLNGSEQNNMGEKESERKKRTKKKNSVREKDRV